MSRVGKMPIAVPQGVDVKITPEAVTVKGGLGTLSLPAHSLVTVSQEGAAPQPLRLARDYTVAIPASVPPGGRTWWTIQ